MDDPGPCMVSAGPELCVLLDFLIVWGLQPAKPLGCAPHPHTLSAEADAVLPVPRVRLPRVLMGRGAACWFVLAAGLTQGFLPMAGS